MHLKCVCLNFSIFQPKLSEENVKVRRVDHEDSLSKFDTNSQRSSMENPFNLKPVATSQSTLDLSPSPFISIESENSNQNEATTTASSSSNHYFDELINELKGPKREVKVAAASASLDALLNLRPKSIKPIEATKSPSILLIPKPITTEPKQSPIPQPFLNSLTLKPTASTQPNTQISLGNQTRTVIYKVDSSDINKASSSNNNKLGSLLLSPKPTTSDVLVVTNNKKLKLTTNQLTKVKSSLNEAAHKNDQANTIEKKYEDVYCVESFLEMFKSGTNCVIQ